MWLRSIALALSIASQSSAWERRVVIEAKDWTDSPSPHPLTYFQSSHCVDRAPKERRVDATCKPDHTSLTQVGFSGKWPVYDLKYLNDSGEVDAKSVLIRMPSGEFREVFYRDYNDGDSTTDTAVIKLEKASLLYSRYDIAGNLGFSLEYFFSIDASGNKVMRLDPLINAGQRQLPAELVAN